MTDLSERLSNIHPSFILYFAIVLTFVRLALIQKRDSISRVVVEISEAALFTVVLMFLLVFPFGFKVFYIPSPSMHPTFVEDDRIVVDKFQYRIKSPNSKNIVVFMPPPLAAVTSGEQPDPDGIPTPYVKRLIGLPGDVIEVHAGVVLVGTPGDQRILTHEGLKQQLRVGDDTAHVHMRFVSNGIQIYNGSTWKFLTKANLASQIGYPENQVKIVPGYTVRNGVKLNEPYLGEDPSYDLKFFHGMPLRRNEQGEVSVALKAYNDPSLFDKISSEHIPPGKFVVFGDNRNFSNDSSYWGYLDEPRIIGRASLLFYPLDRFKSL